MYIIEALYRVSHGAARLFVGLVEQWFYFMRGPNPVLKLSFVTHCIVSHRTHSSFRIAIEHCATGILLL